MVKAALLEGVLIELQEDESHWRLGQSQVTWRPPKDQARALYERLAAEVQAARGRKPDFGEDESEGRTQQRYLGWTWCKERCQALVALDSDGHMSLDRSSQIDETRPAVLLQVFTPEGPQARSLRTRDEATSVRRRELLKSSGTTRKPFPARL